MPKNLHILQKEIEQLTIAKEKAEASNIHFLANMSHDIKTPISGIISTAEYLMQCIDHPEYQTRINDIVQSGLCLLDLINEIIESSKHDVNEISESSTRFKPVVLLQNIEKLMQPIIKTKGLRLDVQVSNVIPAFLIGDHTQLYRILINLVANAIKFTKQGGVTIQLELSKETLHEVVLKISVKDTGIGIPKDKQKSIFEKFTQLNPSYKETYQGSGLGLHIVREFVDAMKGEIYVTSEEGKGSEFICLIPFKKVLTEENFIDQEDAPLNNARTLRQIASSYGTLQNKREPLGQISLPSNIPVNILIIEDNEIAARAASDILKSLGTLVTVAYTGQSALDLFKSQSYDLVYMDLGLPDIAGEELAKKLCQFKKMNAQTMPIYALSAHIDQALIQKLTDIGLDAVYSKPLLKNQAIQDLELIHSLNTNTTQHILEQSSKNITFDTNSLPIIDLESSTKMINLDQNRAKILLNLFFQELPIDLKEIEQSYANQDLPKFIHALHKLHGSLAYCGAPRLKNLVQNMEEILRSGSVQQWDTLYEQFLGEIDMLKDAYDKL